MTLGALDPFTALIVVHLQKGVVGAGGAPGRSELNRSGAAARPEGWDQLIPDLRPQAGDIRVTKHSWGAFTGTGLDAELRSLSVTRVVVCGIATSIGVESTARQAHELGYTVTLAVARAAVHTVGMARLIYSGIASLDGYTEDASGGFDWSAPDEEVHAFVNDLERPIGTYLYGRRMYEVMKFWQGVDPDAAGDDSAAMRDYGRIWQGADKIVYSSTLREPATPRTRIESRFDADAVSRLKESSPADLSIGGPEIAAHALRAGLVDELQLFLNPVVVGGGKAYLPEGVRLDLALLSERRFTGGVVYLHYAVS